MGRENVPPAVKLAPLAVKAVLPRELIITFPVVLPPKVKFAISVTPRLPSPVRKVATFAVVPEILAVGTPLFTFMKANLAEEVASEPIKTSTVLFFG